MSARRGALLTVWVSVGLLAMTLWVAFIPELILEANLPGIDNQLRPTQLLKAQNDIRANLLQALGVLLLISGGYATWRQVSLARHQLLANQRADLAEAFASSIQHLNSHTQAVRIGGIVGLRKIAEVEMSESRDIAVLLAGFVREHASQNRTEGEPTNAVANDCAVAVRAVLQISGGNSLDFSDLSLRHIDLSSCDLSNVELADGDLRFADLRHAILLKTDLTRCDLRGADLRGADLSTAILTEARFQGARSDDATRWTPEFSPSDHGVKQRP